MFNISKIVSLILCVTLLVVVCPSPAAEEAVSSVLFSDDFSGGLGKWSGAVSSELCEYNGQSALMLKGTGNSLIPKMDSYSSYYVSLDILMETNKYFGIFLNYQNINSTYLLQYYNDSVSFYIKQSATFTQLGTVPINLSIGKLYRINVKADNGNFVLFVDGKQIAEFSDSSIKNGSIGIRDYADAKNSYVFTVLVTEDEKSADEYFGESDVPNIVEGFDGGLSRWSIKGNNGFSIINDGGNKKLSFNKDDKSYESLIVAGNSNWKDYNMQMQLEHMDNNSIGMLFRYIDEGNYYMVQYKSGDGVVKVVQREDYGELKTLAQKSFNFENSSYNVGYRVAGDKITVLIDGQPIMTCGGIDRKNGAVGIRGFAGTFMVDNVTVLPLGSQEKLDGLDFGASKVTGQEGCAGELTKIDFSLPDYKNSPLTGKTTKERFQQRVSELPEEMEIIKPALIKGGTEIYVATDGSDNNTGTIDNPLATIDRAVDVLRTMEINDGAVIYIREGIYKVDDTISINNLKINGAPVIISNYGKEEVKLIGGETIGSDKFEKISDNELIARLDPVVASKIYVAELDDKVSSSTTIKSTVYFNSQPMTLARYPNSGYVKTGEILDPGPRVDFGEEDDGRGFEFVLDDLTPTTWKNTGELYMFGAFAREWSIYDVRIREIKENSIRGDRHAQYGARAGLNFYYYNVLEELDVPGEFYIDRNSNKLYIYPISELNENSEIVINTLSRDMLSVENSRNIVINGISLDCGSGKGISFKNCNNVMGQGLKISNFVGNCFDIQESNVKTGIINSEVRNTAGAYLSGGDRVELMPGKNFIQNTNMYVNDLKLTEIRGIGNIFSHNYICGAAINVNNANENIIEYNEIVATNHSSNDAGAIYVGSDITKRGNQIRYNYIHHIDSVSNKQENPFAIYLDDVNSDTQAYGNVIYDVPVPFHLNGGRENSIFGNLMIAETPGTTGIILASIVVSDVPNYEGFVFWDLDGPNKIYKYINNFPIKEAPWKERYPLLANYMEDEPRLPKYNYLANNILVNYEKIETIKESLDTIEMSDNLIVKSDRNIGIANYSGRDFTFDKNAEVYKLVPGFKAPPFEKMGLINKKKVNIGQLSPLLPVNKQQNINAGNATLIWTALPFAHIYDITVARDPQMTDIVGKYRSNHSNFVFTEGEYGETYYWKVEPVSEAKSIDIEYVPMTPASFTCTALEAKNLLHAEMIEETLSEDIKNPEKTAEVKAMAKTIADKIAKTRDKIKMGDNALFDSIYAEYKEYESKNIRTVYKQDYEKLADGAMPEKLIITNAKSGKVTVDGNGVFELADEKLDAYSVFMQEIDEITGNFEFNMKVKPMQDDCLMNIKYRSNEGDPVAIVLNKGGIINIAKEKGYVVGDKIGNYKAGEWLNIRVFGSIPKRCYNIEVNGEMLVENKVFEDSFTKELLFNTIVITIGNNNTEDHKNTGTFYFDNIELKTSQVRIDELAAISEFTNSIAKSQKYRDIIFLADTSEFAMVNSEVTELEAPVFIQNGRTMVPLRFISENMGISDVEWNEKERSVTVKEGGRAVKMRIGEKSYTVDGNERVMDTAPVLRNGRTFVPLRALAESLGFYADYESGLVYVSSGEVKVDEISAVIILSAIK